MSKAKPSKKEMERHQLDSFKRSWPDFPDCKIEEREEPDFLLRCKERTIGIELTELYWEAPAVGMPMQARETLLQRIVDRACRMYQAKGLPAVHVSVHFNHWFSPSKSDVYRLADVIEAWAEKMLPVPPVRGARFEESYDHENRDYFPEEILSLSLQVWPEGYETSFSSPSAHFIPELEEKDICRTLQLKESKVVRYREACDETWLLINSDFGPLSTFFERNDEVFRSAFLSSFDRVFFMAHAGASPIELSIRCPAPL